MDDLSVFKSLWPGGYFEGNPLDPKSPSSYGALAYIQYPDLGNISVLHATYLKCIQPYISKDKIALEIGSGRGAWSKCMLGFRELVVIDPVSAEDTGFWEYVGEHYHVHYIHIDDFSLRSITDHSIDYVFSFGCLCHVSFDGIQTYAANMFDKLKPGADCFWMIADRYKFYTSTGKDLIEGGIGGWHDAGLVRTCNMLMTVGYDIIEPDVGSCLRDPIIHFRKE